MTKPEWSIAALTFFAMPSLGCHHMAILLANMQGGEEIEAEYEMAKGPLLIFIDDRRSQVTETKAIREMHDTIADNFLQFKVNTRVIPYREFQRLQQDEQKFEKMSAREVGEKLGADQVLYLGVQKFTLYSEPGAPLFKGIFSVRVKVLSTERKADVRLWPREKDGKLVTAETPPTPTDGDKTAPDVATEIGIKLGQRVAGLFYKHKEFDE
ncbi:MAG TPA: hypothetical protein VNT79_14720 [Phycisphaerae bacterium]|nr:hypothetical protein [Phycisphaerae bacterium]